MSMSSRLLLSAALRPTAVVGSSARRHLDTIHRISPQDPHGRFNVPDVPARPVTANSDEQPCENVSVAIS